ncbi:hypothetical protein D9M69_505760 [compost metagenome]
MQRFLEHRGGAGDRRFRVLQLGGRVGRAAGFAVVAVLVGGAAFRAGALDEAVGQEHLLFRVEVLGDRAGGDVAGLAQLEVDGAGQLAVLVRVGRVVVVEVHQEVGEVGHVLGAHGVDQLFRGDPFALGAQHDRRTVGVVSADVGRLVATHLLETHPDVGLDVLQHVTEVDGTVGVGQGAGDENLAGFGHGDQAVRGNRGKSVTI